MPLKPPPPQPLYQGLLALAGFVLFFGWIVYVWWDAFVLLGRFFEQEPFVTTFFVLAIAGCYPMIGRMSSPPKRS